MNRKRNGEIKYPAIGIVEWFRPGEYKRVEEIIKDLKILGVKQLRTGFSWVEWTTPEGKEWHKWFIPKLASELEILPCFSYTPPLLGKEFKISSPPKNSAAYADFIDDVISEVGERFEWVELWNEPNNINDWDYRLDPSWRVFGDMVSLAASRLKAKGKKCVLGGMSPIDPNWLELLARRNVLANIHAIGIHGYPGTWQFEWDEWELAVSKVKEVLKRNELKKEIWITSAGYATWRHDELNQLKHFAKALEAPVERVYWYSGQDLDPEISYQEIYNGDERHFHFGLKQFDGSPKLLYRAWAKEGIEGIKNLAEYGVTPHKQEAETITSKPKFSVTGLFKPKIEKEHVLITGGAGFIGCNLAERLLSQGKRVMIYDNLSRAGVEENLLWLRERHGDNLLIRVADVRNQYALKEALGNAESVFHFAAQVAVTTSIDNPSHDFEVNAGGTFNILESLRVLNKKIPFVYTSTNKVYGDLADIKLEDGGMKYFPANETLNKYGISEKRHLDFHSPYGCSKGAADQYVKDYARIYDIPTVVFRMSCIYGPRQFGTEDQGWAAHFIIRILNGEPITIYGDGKQVRDILFVDDLLNAFEAALENIDKVKGGSFNIGGGPANAVSIIEALNIIKRLNDNFLPAISYSDWRKGDQYYYVSDTREFYKASGWKPNVSAMSGITALYEWLYENRKSVIDIIKPMKAAL